MSFFFDINSFPPRACNVSLHLLNSVFLKNSLLYLERI